MSQFMMKQLFFNTCLKFVNNNFFKNLNNAARSFSNYESHKSASAPPETEKIVGLSEGNYNFQPCLDDDLSHIPVMSKEVIEALQPKDNQTILDMTFGAGGHSTILLNAASVKIICLDRDPVAYKKAIEFSKEHDGFVTPLLGRFSEIKQAFESANIRKNSLDGILIDAGCSSMQMDSGARGFSISKNGALDMRMDGDRYPHQPTAADVLNTLDVPSLVKIFRIYGEEKHAKKVAQALFDARYMLKTINTTHELADLIQSILGSEQRFDKLQRSSHVATKIFQALRIFVNNELNELNYGMEMAYEYLKPGGRLVTLTFHSLEDRIVKRHIIGIDMDEPVSQNIRQKYSNAFMWHSQEAIDGLYSNRWTSVYKHVVKPSAEEVHMNPRSRSAKLRAAVKNKVA